MYLKTRIFRDLGPELIRDFGKISLAKSSVFILGLIFLPILTRLYTPESYGHFSFLTALVTLINSLILLSYNQALLIARDSTEKKNLTLACLIFLVAGTFLSIPILKFLDIPKNSIEAFVIIPVGIILYGLIDIFSKLNVRSKFYSWSAKMEVSGNGAIKASHLILGSLGSMGLIVGDLIGRGLVIILNLVKYSTKFRAVLTSFSFRNIKQILKSYKNYPFFILPSNLLSRLSVQLPVFLVGTFFGDASLGNLSIAITLLNVPVTIIGNSLATVYTTRITELGQARLPQVAALTKSLIEKLLLLGIVPFSILILFGNSIIELVAGERWSLAGKIIRIMAFYHFFYLAVFPLLSVFQILNKEKLIFIYSGILLVLISGSIFIGIQCESFILTIFLLTASNTLISVFQGVSISRLLGISFVTKPVMNFLILILGGFLILYLV